MTAEALRQVLLDKGSLRLSLTGETPLLNKCACEVVVKHSIGRKRKSWYVIPEKRQLCKGSSVHPHLTGERPAATLVQQCEALCKTTMEISQDFFDI